MHLLLQTAFSLAALIVRVALGVVMFPHGGQKVIGWFGGGGFEATLTQFQQEIGIPIPFRLLTMAAEFLGSGGRDHRISQADRGVRDRLYGDRGGVDGPLVEFFPELVWRKTGEWYRIPRPRVRDGALLDHQRRRMLSLDRFILQRLAQ